MPGNTTAQLVRKYEVFGLGKLTIHVDPACNLKHDLTDYEVLTVGGELWLLCTNVPIVSWDHWSWGGK